MCLRTFQRTQKTAEQDKTVYKLVIVRSDGIYTPYLDVLIPADVINGQKPFKAKGKTKKEKDWNGFNITGGNIHTFATASQAFYEAKAYVMAFGNVYGKTAVYECIIPKGTKYYYGVGKAEYASKQIRFVKQVHKPQWVTQTCVEFC